MTSCHVILSYHNGEIEVPSIEASVGMLIYVLGFPAVKSFLNFERNPTICVSTIYKSLVDYYQLEFH